MVTRKKTKKATKKSSSNESIAEFAASPPDATLGNSTGVETTGRFIVVFKDEAAESKTIRTTLNQVAGLKDITASSDFSEGAIAADDLAHSDVVQFDKLGIAVVSGDQDIQALAAAMSESGSPILAIEPEYIAYP